MHGIALYFFLWQQCFSCCWSSHGHTHSEGILPQRSQDMAMVWRGACVRYFTEFGHIIKISLISWGADRLNSRYYFWVELLPLAFTRFKVFILWFRNFKKLCSVSPGESIKNCKEQIEGGTVMFNETWLGMFEVILESAPQVIIQLHATIVQQEQVLAIQIMKRNFLSAYFLK